MPKGIYTRTEEQKRKISESRRRYYDEHGRVVNMNQKESPEAYRNYQREYQRIWRKRHKNYYRDLKRKKNEAEDMSKLQEIQNVWNLFVARGIEYEYKTSAYNEDELKKLADDVTSKITNYLEEMRKENEDKDEVQ